MISGSPKRHQHGDGEKEQHTDQRAAADAQCDFDVPSNQHGEGGHGRWRSSLLFRER
jgi:hypothetical protein